MPNPNHLVMGKVILSGTSQPVNCATVTITDSILGESLSAITTNSAGEYVGDLVDLTSAWSSGDTISVTATYGNRSKTETRTISGGSTLINLTLSITTYFDYDKETREGVYYNAKDLLDRDIEYTRNSTGRITKEVNNYGKFTVTKHFTRDSKSRIINENWVVT